jgi:hypothetical protein
MWLLQGGVVNNGPGRRPPSPEKVEETRETRQLVRIGFSLRMFGMIRTSVETRFSTKARLLDDTAGESCCVLEEARVFVAFLSPFNSDNMKTVNRTETLFSVVQDPLDECKVTIEAFAPSALEETPILGRFVVSMSQTQIAHWEDGHPILITSVSPQALGSEEVTFGRVGDYFITFYPPTRCNPEEKIAEEGGVCIRFSEPNQILPPEIPVMYDLHEENPPCHVFRRAVCVWA